MSVPWPATKQLSFDRREGQAPTELETDSARLAQAVELLENGNRASGVVLAPNRISQQWHGFGSAKLPLSRERLVFIATDGMYSRLLSNQNRRHVKATLHRNRRMPDEYAGQRNGRGQPSQVRL